jgi:hypothetical protein
VVEGPGKLSHRNAYQDNHARIEAPDGGISLFSLRDKPKQDFVRDRV